jgi:hypothetical protein
MASLPAALHCIALPLGGSTPGGALEDAAPLSPVPFISAQQWPAGGSAAEGARQQAAAAARQRQGGGPSGLPACL